jgi:hypothetical protein
VGASATTRPVLPGVYPSYDAERRTVVPPNAGAVVAVPIIHTWGPVGDPQLFESFAQYEDTFGTDESPGRIAVYNAFVGEGLEGAGGAGAVLVSRLAGAAAATAQVVLNDTGAAAALTVRGAHPGTRGNRFSVQVLPVANGVQEVVILDGTVEVETYVFTIADPGARAGLVAQLNTSDNVAATLGAEGAVALASGTFPLAGGADGNVLTGADWTDGAAGFEFFDFALFAPFDLPWAQGAGAASVRDAISALVAWRDDQESQGHRFTLVVGGALDELPADAIARAQSYANPGVITVGGPGFNDATFGPLSSSQMATRYAGIRAQRGEGMSADMARVAGGVPRPLPTGSIVSLSDVEDMVQAGVIVLTRDRWSVAPTRIAADVNTYQPNIGNADPLATPVDRPKAIWGTPKFVLSMQQFANDAQAELEREMVGKVVVNDTTRQAAAARVLRMAKDRERIGAFDPGTIVEPVPGSDTDTFVVIKVSLTFGRALAQLFIRGTVR